MQCIWHLRQSTLKTELITIIDHAVTPLILDEKMKSGCVVIRPHANRGYAAGVNVGLRSLKGINIHEEDVVVCMNNDVEVGKDGLEAVAALIETFSDPTLVGPLTRTIHMFTGRAILGKKYSKSVWYSPAYIDGAFMAGKWSTWMLAGPMPEDYFMYAEDVLFSWQASRNGVILKEVALAVGHPPRESDMGSDKIYYLVRNGARLLEEESSIPWKIWWFVWNRVRLFFHTLLSPLISNAAVREGLSDAISHKGGPR